MKKIFSAILLMTMMVFSVGTLVSCNDLVEEVQGIQTQVNSQETAIKALNDEITALESALSTAQAAADKAQADANAAKAAAEQAKADAIAEALAQVEALKAAYEAAIAEVGADVDALSKSVDAALEVINTRIAVIEETIKADKAELDADVAALLEADSKLSTQLDALEKYVETLEIGGTANASKIDSLMTDLEAATAEIEAIWADLKDENTGLFALVAGNASAITAMQEDFQAQIDELYASIYGEGPSSLFSMVASQANIIEELVAKTDAYDEAVAAINKDLSTFVKALEGIANQIQDVEYVPTSENIASMQYYLGTTTLTSKKYESPLMVMATYEVSPKALVADLSDECIGFSTVATKVAPAEYFPAKIVDRDPATGRMIVVGYIAKNDRSYAYTTLTNNTTDKVAFSLNIAKAAPFNFEDADGLQNVIDAGSYVQSEYVNATVAGAAKNVADYVVAAQVNDFGRVVYGNFADGFEVPYSPVDATSARNLFADYKGLYVNFEGTYLDLAKAGDVLGFELTPEFGQFKATNNAGKNPYTGQDKVSPIAITGEKFETVATLVGSNDYKGADAIDQYVTVTVDGVKINGTAVNVTIASTYKVGYKKADITLTGADFTWSYKFGTEVAGEYNVAGNEFPWLGAATELDVVGYDDITVLYTVDPASVNAGVLNNYQFSPTSPLTFTATTRDSKGNPYNAEVDIISLSKKAVRIVGGNVPFAKGEELTYKFNAVLYNKDRVQYTLGFEFTTSAMPTDKVIELPAVQVAAKYNYAMTAPVPAIDAILATDAAYYPEAAAGLASYKALSDAIVDYTAENLVVYDPSTPAANQANFDFVVANWPTYDMWHNLTAVYDASSITINEAEIGDKFSYVYDYSIFGVKYTFVVAAEVVKATGYSLDVNPVLVNTANVVNLTKGTVKYPTVANGATSVTAGLDYELEVIDLRDYVMVVGENQYDLANEELALTYKVNNYYKDPYTQAEYFGDDFANVEYAYTNTLVGTVDEVVNQLTWNLASLGKNTQSISVTIDLVAENADMFDPKKRTLYDSETLTLVVPELLKATAIAPVYDAKKASNCKGAYSVLVADANTGELNWTPVNAVKGLQVNATNAAKTALYNPYAADLTEYWADYNNSTKETILPVDDVFAVFNQTEVAVATKRVNNVDVLDVRARFASTGKAVPADYYTVDAAGNVALTLNSGEITDNIIVTVPLVFGHDYCAGNHRTEVEVLFVK